MKTKIFLLIILSALSYGFFKQSGTVQQSYYSDVNVAPNFRIFPSGVSQTEPEIVPHPTNPNILFASSFTLNGAFRSEGVYVTTNGGNSWFGSDTCKGQLIQNHAGDPGPMIDKDGRFYMTHLGSQSLFVGQFAHYSTDLGLTWSNQYPIQTGDQYKGDIRSDISPASPYYGKTHYSWVPIISPISVYYSSTTNGGVNWAAPRQINNPTQRNNGAMVKMNRNGDVYITWAAVSSISPFPENYLGLAKSTNGGANFSVTENIYNVGGVSGFLPQKGNILVNGLPDIDIDMSTGLRSGWIYIITTEKNLSPAGSDLDVIFRRSSDGGQTWSPRIRVNQDPVNNGKIQFFPAMRVDDGGGINIIYYDDRRCASDSSEVFMSRSTDGGDTWKDFPISDHRFKPSPIAGTGAGYMGDNIGITNSGNFLWALWMDNSTGIYQVWATKLDVTTLGINQISNVIPDKFKLAQNYPNPFNPTTNIKFSIMEKGEVNMNVYNTEGKLIQTLVNKVLPAGEYEYTFDAAALNSGVYFVTIQANGFTDSKKMVLVK
ncbi:MAG: T9SS type A sorting domain-containing protein [Bacteroidetes bacterium]|nr:T9SS type A sorting domain-containing protein [Bacteroidota bacterium]